MCQKASGNYFQPFTGVKREEFAWTKGVPGTFASSELIERDFCRDCGTPLTYRPRDRDRVSVTIGSLDRPDSVRPETQHGVESRVVDLDALAVLPAVTTAQWAKPERLARLASRQHPDHD
jgi:hypothetical protein